MNCRNDEVTYLLFGIEDFSLSVLGLLQLLSLEVGVIQVVRDLHIVDVDPCLGGNHVDLVDSTKWAAVQMEGS